MKIAIGGTFSPLHAGHTYLLKKAFYFGKKVVIGLTSDSMITKEVKSYEERKKELINYLEKKIREKNFEIMKIENKYGPTIEKDFDAIVVSPETKKTAKEINEKRKKKDLEPLEIIETDYILAEDWKPISSTRIRKGIINKNGKILNPNN